MYTMKKQTWLFALIPAGIALLFFIRALLAPLRMDPVERRLDRLGLKNNIHSVEDLIISDSIDVVFVGRITESGKTTIKSGVFQPNTKKINGEFPAYYADSPVFIERVIKGAPRLDGTIVTVRELLLEESSGRYITSRLQDGEISRAVFCTHVDNGIYMIDVPEICIIPEMEDGTLQFWDNLEHRENYNSFENIDAMAQEKLGRFYRIDLSPVDREATENELAELKSIFEKREYNAVIRSLPNDKNATKQLIIGMLTVQIGSGTSGVISEPATDEELAAYEKESGMRPEVLWRITISDVRKIDIFGTSNEAGLDWAWKAYRSKNPRNYLTTIHGREGYFYFEPDTSDIVTIEPISATFSANNNQRYIDCDLVYFRFFEEGLKIKYTLSFQLDRSGGFPLICITSGPTP